MSHVQTQIAEIQALIQDIQSWRTTETKYHFQKFTRPWMPLSPSRWLAAQTQFPQLYWKGRNENNEWAWLGAVWELKPGEPMSAAVDILKEMPDNCRLAISLPFEASHTQVRSVYLPEIEIKSDNNGCEVSVTVAVKDGQAQDIAALNHRLLALNWTEIELRSTLPSATSVQYSPDREQWDHLIETALGELKGPDLSKIVLARQTELTLSHAIHPAEILAQLGAQKGAHYLFWTRLQDGSVFFGRSPERLFRLTQSELETEALAGTRGGENEPADQHDFLANPKERHEHQLVSEDIQAQLNNLSEEPPLLTPTTVHQAASLSHLKSDFHCTLRPGLTWVDSLETLHPTAAVGGYPRAEALARIIAWEPFDRGRYAGPIGWASNRAADFAVGIRSGVSEGTRLTLYSGTGIVSESNPDQEWEELNAKIADIVNLFK